MSVRAWASQAIDGLLDFGRVLAGTSQGANKTTLVKIEGLVAGAEAETIDGAELWGNAAVQYRPPAPDATGATEILFVRRGDEVIGIATIDRRWQVDLVDGEVVIRALSGTTSRIRLKPDGSVIIEAGVVKLGSSAASEGIALGTTLQSFLGSLKTWADTHVHSGVTVGGGVTGIGAPLSPAVPTVASANHKVGA